MLLRPWHNGHDLMQTKCYTKWSSHVIEEQLIFADGHQRVWDSWERWVLLMSSWMLLELHFIYWHLVPFYRVCTWQWHLFQCSSYTRFADEGLVMTVLSSKTLELCCYLLTYSLWGVIGIPQFLELYLVSGVVWVSSILLFIFLVKLLTVLASTNFDFYSIKGKRHFSNFRYVLLKAITMVIRMVFLFVKTQICKCYYNYYDISQTSLNLLLNAHVCVYLMVYITKLQLQTTFPKPLYIPHFASIHRDRNRWKSWCFHCLWPVR
jgi:hypothetical protein